MKTRASGAFFIAIMRKNDERAKGAAVGNSVYSVSIFRRGIESTDCSPIIDPCKNLYGREHA
jgi:hypothetical protein